VVRGEAVRALPENAHLKGFELKRSGQSSQQWLELKK